MRIQYLLLLVLLIISSATYSQKPPEQSINEAIRIQNFQEALEIAKQWSAGNPDMALPYFYIAYITQYQVMHGRPLDPHILDDLHHKVIINLEKALIHDPGMGNARYLLGVEFFNRGWQNVQYSPELLKPEFQKAFDHGGLPAWLLEDAKNHLILCPPDALLFISGQEHFNAITWLQVNDNLRQDVSLVSVEMLNQPWYLQLISEQANGLTKTVPLSWNQTQINQLRNFPWRPKNINLEIPIQLNDKYGVDHDVNTMNWLVEPDLITPARKALMSPGLAAFVDIIEQNLWKRPVMLNMGGH
jgi:hypothetical protein